MRAGLRDWSAKRAVAYLELILKLQLRAGDVLVGLSGICAKLVQHFCCNHNISLLLMAFCLQAVERLFERAMLNAVDKIQTNRTTHVDEKQDSESQR